MASSETGTRIVATCVRCGSIYAALRVGSDEIQPIGSRNGCASCGATEFRPVSEYSSDAAGVGMDSD